MLYEPCNADSNCIRLVITGIVLPADIMFQCRRDVCFIGRCLPCHQFFDGSWSDLIEDFLTERPGIQICDTYHLAQNLCFLSELEKASFSDENHFICHGQV